MKSQSEADRVIKEYEESRKKIREIIAEFEEKERVLFRIMLQRLSELDSEDSDSFEVGSKFAGALD